MGLRWLPQSIFYSEPLAIFLSLNFIGEEEGGFEVASPFHSPTTLLSTELPLGSGIAGFPLFLRISRTHC